MRLQIIDNHRSRFASISAGWKQRKMRFAVKHYQIKKNTDKNPTVLSLTKGGLKVKTDLAFGKSTENYVGHQIVDNGQFVFAVRDFDATPILCGVADTAGCISNLYIVFDVSNQIDAKFLEYYFWGLKYGFSFFKKLSFGMRYSFNRTQFENIPLLHPDLSTQRVIADFLDRETARIDSLIKKKQRLVELLVEKSSVLITIAVTGNSPNTLENSVGGNRRSAEGGDEVKRLRFVLSSAQVNAKFKRDPSALVSFAPMDALVGGLGGLQNVDTKPFSELSKGSYNYFEDGDVLLAKVTPCFENGKKAIADNLTNGAGFATSEVLVFRPNASAIDTRFLRYFFCSEDFRYQAIASMTGAGGLRRISERAVLDSLLLITDLPTQRAIVGFLDRETTRIDKIIERTRISIDRLKEYRSALITAAVTGHINVSTYARSRTTDRQLDAIQSEIQA